MLVGNLIPECGATNWTANEPILSRLGQLGKAPVSECDVSSFFWTLGHTPYEATGPVDQFYMGPEAAVELNCPRDSLVHKLHPPSTDVSNKESFMITGLMVQSASRFFLFDSQPSLKRGKLFNISFEFLPFPSFEP